MPQVHTANHYYPGCLGSLGDGKYILLKQFDFPDTYRHDEKHTGADHDRCIQWDYNHAQGACKRHMGTGDMAIGDWSRKANKAGLMAFLIDILKADKNVEWTGCRVMGTVNRSNGYSVFTLELFAKAPDSDTEVYSGSSAPNVNQKSLGKKDDYYSNYLS